MLFDDQRPNPLNPGCPGDAPDSTDPLAQFPSEPADAPNETDRAPRSAEGDHSLFAFASETAVIGASTVTDASTVSDATTVSSAPTVADATGYRRLLALWPVVPTTVMLTLSCIRVVGLGAWNVLRASRHGRRAVQSYRWTYPASLFLSGAAAGAFLVIVARVPAEDSVAAQVSAQPATRVVAANYTVAERPAAQAPTAIQRAQREQSVSARRVTVEAGQQSVRQAPVAVAVPTVRARQQSFVGSISINSRPQGAVVFLNGRRVGTTPLLMPELPVGSRAVRLTMSGYSTWSRAVQVVADRRTTLSATLEQVRQ